MITGNQRKRLENAGYTVSKSGNSVLTKDGATIGGINSNGKVFAGLNVSLVTTHVRYNNGT